jgi:hypothetical protein
MITLVTALSFTSPAAWGAGQTPGALASCETAHPSGTPIPATVSVVTSLETNLANIVLTIQFKQAVHTFSAQDIAVSNLTVMDTACELLGPFSDRIVNAIGLPDRTIKVTAKSVIGWLCPHSPFPDRCPSSGTLNNPGGLSLTPTNPPDNTILAGNGNITLYAEP